MAINRSLANPILSPNAQQSWEAHATFNPCVLKYTNNRFVVSYRAMAAEQIIEGKPIRLSTIGMAESRDGITFQNRRQIIAPEYEWERYGCEDPRMTILDGRTYIFYTALSQFPPQPSDVTVAVAITQDFQTFEKHHVTPFNSKAMTLFPERINGKYAALLTIDTDILPARIAYATADTMDQFWSKDYWSEWYAHKQTQSLLEPTTDLDQVEVGAPPIRIPEGWLVIYSYMVNLRAHHQPLTFGIHAALLDAQDPRVVLKKTTDPLFTPETPYEHNGQAPSVVFPSGAILNGTTVSIYYGGGDQVSCLATCDVNAVLESMV